MGRYALGAADHLRSMEEAAAARFPALAHSAAAAGVEVLPLGGVDTGAFPQTVAATVGLAVGRAVVDYRRVRCRGRAPPPLAG